MTRARCLVLALAALLLAPGVAGAAKVEVTEDLEPLVRELFAQIAALSSYRADAPMPTIFEMPQREVEQAVCDEPCNVVAAYFPGKAIYLASNLDPRREPADRAALLHELVHYLQYVEGRFAQLAPCERFSAEEREAFAIQNAYLARIGSGLRVAAYADSGCEPEEGEGAGR